MENLVYRQSTGEITLNNGLVAIGWAGKGKGKNNHEMQNVRCVGPLPCGWYTIEAWEVSHPGLGPMVAHLRPDPGNEMFGRDAFYVHGAAMDPSHYGQESKGCIVVPRTDRLKVKDTGITRLEVIP
jgi:hypothetical protein